MATIFNQSSVVGEPAGPGAMRQRLLIAARVSGTAILLDRLALKPGGEARLAIPAGSVAWLQVLEGKMQLAHGGNREVLTDAHVAFLPGGFAAGLRAQGGNAVLYGEVPQADRLDPGFTKNVPFRLADWTREPVLDSEHDARKRIYLVTPKLFGTKAVKGEMIIYPPGTAAANHHHEGAEHFMYVLRGRGTIYANEKPCAVRAGDVIYYPDRERHYLEAAKDEELVFAEFFAPADRVQDHLAERKRGLRLAAHRPRHPRPHSRARDQGAQFGAGGEPGGCVSSPAYAPSELRRGSLRPLRNGR